MIALANKAVDAVSREEVKAAPELKGSRYLWLKDSSKFSMKQITAFHYLSRSGLKTVNAFRIKESLRDIYALAQNANQAGVLFERWYSWARRSRLEPIKALALTGLSCTELRVSSTVTTEFWSPYDPYEWDGGLENRASVADRMDGATLKEISRIFAAVCEHWNSLDYLITTTLKKPVYCLFGAVAPQVRYQALGKNRQGETVFQPNKRSQDERQGIARRRVDLHAELRRIQQDLGITNVYVTHDQEEALASPDINGCTSKRAIGIDEKCPGEVNAFSVCSLELCQAAVLSSSGEFNS